MKMLSKEMEIKVFATEMDHQIILIIQYSYVLKLHHLSNCQNTVNQCTTDQQKAVYKHIYISTMQCINTYINLA